MIEKVKNLYSENSFLGALVVLDLVRLIELEQLNYKSFVGIIKVLVVLGIGAFIYKILARYLDKPSTKPAIRAGVQIILGLLYILMF